jgi:hypothetical protein
MKIIDNQPTHLQKLIDIDSYIENAQRDTQTNNVALLRLQIASTVINNFIRFPTLFFLQLDFTYVHGNRNDEKKVTVSPLVIGGKNLNELKLIYESDPNKRGFYQFVSSDRNTYASILDNEGKEYDLMQVRNSIKASLDYLKHNIPTLQKMQDSFPIFNMKRVLKDGTLATDFNEQIETLIGIDGMKLLHYYILNVQLTENAKSAIQKNKI